MNYKVTVAYNGSHYHGWAIQKDVVTVQGAIQTTLYEIFKRKIKINGSGRTDAYVHAYAQVFNFKHKKLTLDGPTMTYALKRSLPKDIEIIKVVVVDDTFHARYHVLDKEYVYCINTNERHDIFQEDIIYQYNQDIDIDKINKLAQEFVGEHDFLSFSTTQIANSTRCIKSIIITNDDGIVKIFVKGTGFLRNMVRMIVGNLLVYNNDKKSYDDIIKLLNNPKKGASITKAPGCGLYLLKVNYQKKFDI